MATNEPLKRKQLLQHIAIHAVLVALGCMFILPLVWMLSTSLKPIEETMASPPVFLPTEFQWKN